MANLFQPTLIPALDDDGNPISGAKLYFYLTGTTVPATYYLDQEGETAGPHPLLTDDNDGCRSAFRCGSGTRLR
jgi:hypothetical protein